MDIREVRVSDKFFKDIAVDQYVKVREVLLAFISDFRSVLSYNEMPTKYNAKKIEGPPKDLGLFKFRFSKRGGDRISYIDQSTETGHVITFLRFMDHDHQISIMRNGNYEFVESSKIDTDDQLLLGDVYLNEKDDYDFNQFSDFSFKLDPSFLKDHVIESSDLVKMILNSKKEYLYTLTEEQVKHVDDSRGIPYLLSGSAGSGKTTICAYKLLQITQNRPDIKVLYYSYSKELIERASSIYNKYKSTDAQVDFLNFDHLRSRSNMDQPITRLDFEDYLKYLSLSDKQKNSRMIDGKKTYITDYSVDELWVRIRAIIKGGMGRDYERCDYLHEPVLNYTDYLNEVRSLLGIDSSKDDDIKEEQIYEFVTCYYQQWLSSNQRKDYNDCLLEMIHQSDSDYDYLVVDEVQDFTKLEFYMLYHLLKGNCKTHLFVVGDVHQIVSSSLFRFDHIESLFNLKHQLSVEFHPLDSNLRCQNKIVDFANSISEIRKEHIGNMGEQTIKSNIMRGSQPIYLDYDALEKDRLFSFLSEHKRPYVRIITSNEESKFKLAKKYPELLDIINTVEEIKGVESRYVICYNIISDYKEMWSHILTVTKSKDTEHRKYFGHFYVAITRAQENLYFLEDDSHEFYKKIEGYGARYDTSTEFSINRLGFDEAVSSFDYDALAHDHMNSGHYLSASRIFMQAQNIKMACECQINHLINGGESNETSLEQVGSFLLNNITNYEHFKLWSNRLASHDYNINEVIHTLDDQSKINYLEMISNRIEDRTVLYAVSLDEIGDEDVKRNI